MKYLSYVVILVMVLALGCSDQNTPTAMNDNASPVLFKISNAPANSGPIVIRDNQGSIGFRYVDVKRGLTAVHGLDIVDFCTPPRGTTFELVDRQRVFEPNEGAAVNQLLQGSNVTTSVWPFASFDCDKFLTTTPLATGTVDIVSTDNDFFFTSGSRTDAFGFNAHGILDLSGGGTTQFSGHLRFHTKSGGLFKFQTNIQMK